MIAEIDLDGVFLSSMVVTALAALLVTTVIRRLLGLTGIYRLIWHPALFDAALFMIIWAVATVLPLTV